MSSNQRRAFRASSELRTVGQAMIRNGPKAEADHKLSNAYLAVCVLLNNTLNMFV